MLSVEHEPSGLTDLTKEELIALIIAQRDIIARLEERIRDLEAQIHKDSHNSHIPPSRSPHAPIKNMRKKTGKKRGGQKGHKGRTLEMVDNPAHTVIHEVSTCTRCGRSLVGTSPEGYERRQVFDIPPIVLDVTEHRAEKKRCSCGHVTTAAFPEGIAAPAQYGINVQGLLSVFSAYEYMSYDRISELMEHLIGRRINESTVYSLQKRLYEGLHGFEEKSIQHLRGSEVIHNDETGISIEGKRKWLHVACTEELTHYAVDDKRGKEATDRIGILPHFHGRTVHDGWKSYFQYPCRHGLCNAHHLRELVFFEEEEKAPWAVPLKDLLLFAKASVETAKSEGKDHVDPELLKNIDSRYHQILDEALTGMPAPLRTGRRGRVKKTKQQNLIERLLHHKESVLAFLYDFTVPFDNNRAERDVRMMKLKQKISGTFRSLQGAQYFARIRGYISTVRKNGRNVFEEIGNALSGKPFYLEGW